MLLKLLIVFFIFNLGVNCKVITHPKYQYRGGWIAGVNNIDWPSKQGLSVEQQKEEFRNLVHEAKEDNLNALFVHIRPTADSFYPSKIFPWSIWITGVQGKDPGYDPLKFVIEECHKANLELHAWFNPYRISTDTDMNKLVPEHPARKHPEWAFAYGPWLYFNPGLPEVRELIISGIEEIVHNYDVDGVHCDDYFYPYPITGKEIPDEAAFKKYGEKFHNKGDWRRDNVNVLIKEMHERVKKIKSHVKFSVSPFGIWRNNDTDPTGSDTHGLQCYDSLYADSRKWIKQQWIDLIVPQIYWSDHWKAARYDVLVKWWNEEMKGTDVQLYIGHACTRVGNSKNDHEFDNPNIIENQMEFYSNLSHVSGSVFWNMKHMIGNKLGFRDILRKNMLSRPSLIPITKKDKHHFNDSALIENVQNDHPGKVNLSWNLKSPVHSDKVWYFLVYRFDGDNHSHDISNANNLIAKVHYEKDNSQQHFIDEHVEKGSHYTYYVSAVDRISYEGPLSEGKSVVVNK